MGRGGPWRGAEDAAGVLRLRSFLWAFLGREHLRAFNVHYGDDVVLAERRYLLGQAHPRPPPWIISTLYPSVLTLGSTTPFDAI